MSRYRISPAANGHIDEIYDYTADRWGEDQADDYVRDIIAEIERIASRQILWRRLAAQFAVEGYSRSWRSHVIYWREVEDGSVTILAVLHQRMDQESRLRDAIAP